MLYPIHLYTHTAAACVLCMRPHREREKKKKFRLVYESNCSSVAFKFTFFFSKERRRNIRPFFTRPQGNTIGGYVKELPTTPTTIKNLKIKANFRVWNEIKKDKTKNFLK